MQPPRILQGGIRVGAVSPSSRWPVGVCRGALWAVRGYGRSAGVGVIFEKMGQVFGFKPQNLHADAKFFFSGCLVASGLYSGVMPARDTSLLSHFRYFCVIDEDHHVLSSSNGTGAGGDDEMMAMRGSSLARLSSCAARLSHEHGWGTVREINIIISHESWNVSLVYPLLCAFIY